MGKLLLVKITLLITVFVFSCMSSSGMAKINSNDDFTFSQHHFNMLMRCSEKNDMAGWNKWREKYPSEKILLQGAHLYHSLESLDEELFHPRISTLIGAGLTKAYLNGIITEAKLCEAKLFDAILDDAFLIGTNLSAANLDRASLKRAYLSRVNLSNAQIQLADLSSAVITVTNLADAKLLGANLSDTMLISSDLRYAELTGANLTGANLYRAKLISTDISGAILSGTYFRETNLRNANFTLSDLSSARFYKVDLRGSIFSRTIVDDVTSFEECIIDDNTDFTGSGSDNARMEPKMNTQLKNNIRRFSWIQWYNDPKTGSVEKIIARVFWWISDYGSSTIKILWVMLIISLLFFATYVIISFRLEEKSLLSDIPMRIDIPRDINPAPEFRESTIIVNALIEVSSFALFKYQCFRVWFSISGNRWWLLHIFRFACTSMVTFGLSEIDANIRRNYPNIVFLVTLNLMTGYFLLACVVTRIGILFGALSP